MSPKQLTIEFVTDVLVAMLAAILLAQLGGTNYTTRLLFVTILGLFSAVATKVPNWNWYSYPANYTVFAIINQVAGSFCVGVVLGLVVKPSTPAAPPPVTT